MGLEGRGGGRAQNTGLRRPLCVANGRRMLEGSWLVSGRLLILNPETGCPGGLFSSSQPSGHCFRSEP